MTALRTWQLIFALLVALCGVLVGWRMVKSSVGGQYGWHGTHQFARYVASHSMPCNHRVSEADLAEPEGIPGAFRWELPGRDALVGRYLTRAVKEGEVLRDTMLARSPTTGVNASAKLVSMPLTDQPEVLEWMDANSVVAVQAGDTPIAAQVIFVTCTGADRKSCMLTLAIDKAAAVAGEPQKWRLTPDNRELHWTECGLLASGSTDWDEAPWWHIIPKVPPW